MKSKNVVLVAVITMIALLILIGCSSHKKIPAQKNRECGCPNF